MRLTKREKLLLGMLVFAALFYVSYRFFVVNQRAEVDVAQMELSSLMSQVARLSTLEAEEQQLDQEIALVKGEQDEIKSQYFSLIDEQEEVILLLNEFLLNQDVRATSIFFMPPTTETVDDVPLSSMNVTVSFEATYPSLINLLRSVWQFDRKILVSSINMNAAEGDRLNGNLQVNLYDFAHLTDEVDSLFMWFEQMEVKTNPFAAATPVPDFQIRYVFRDSDTAMLTQQPYTPFEDIRGHWAENAINALGERGVFPPTANRNFNPDDYISRGEFIVLLDRLYQWPMPADPIDLTKFEDYETLGRYESSISKAIFSGYLSGFIVGYEDNTLRPFEPMTYEEVEFVMRKVLENEAFSWFSAAQDMETATGHTSPGIRDSRLFITKAEAAYFLNSVN